MNSPLKFIYNQKSELIVRRRSVKTFIKNNYLWKLNLVMVICWRYKFSWKSCVKIRSCNEIALILKSWNLEGRPEESSKCSDVQISLLSKFDVWKFSNDKLKKLLLILLLSEVNMWKVNIVLEDLADRNPQTFRAPLNIAVKISGWKVLKWLIGETPLHFTALWSQYVKSVHCSWKFSW